MPVSYTHLDVYKRQDLDACQGIFCIEGDAGAPVELDEVEKLEEVLPLIWDERSPEARTGIEEQGVVYTCLLYTSYPHSELQASGENVGLPDGQMGNSEVGHLNIGAGRIVYQDLVKICLLYTSKSFMKVNTFSNVCLR